MSNFLISNVQHLCGSNEDNCETETATTGIGPDPAPGGSPKALIHWRFQDMRKSYLVGIGLVITGLILLLVRGGPPGPDGGKVSDRPGMVRERMLLSQDDLLDAPQLPKRSMVPDEFLKTFRSVGAQSSVEFLARRSTGRAEGHFDGHAFVATIDLRSGELLRFDGTIELDSIASPERSLLETIREASAFGSSDRNVCRFESLRIHPANPGQLPNRADTLIEGQVTIGGKTLPMTIAAKTVMESEGQMSIRSEFAIDRKAFGLPVEPRAEGSIRDELVVRLNLRVASAELNAAGTHHESKTLRLNP